MSKWLVLVNAAAGRSPVAPATVVSALKGASIDFELVTPETEIDAIEAIGDGANRGYRHFVVVGGDGTVNLAVNALLNLGLDQPATLGVLPAGTGSDLMRTFALPRTIAEAAQHLATETEYPADVVRIEGEWGAKHYINVAQTGVGAAAVATAPRIKRSFGSARYPMAFAARLPRFPRTMVTVETEKRVYQSEALAVIMANAQYFAGGWNVAPKATLVDGVADIQLINAAKRRAPALVPKLVKGTHLADRAVRRFSAARFTIETEVPWPVEADGDLIGNTPLAGTVIPAAIRLKI